MVTCEVYSLPDCFLDPRYKFGHPSVNSWCIFKGAHPTKRSYTDGIKYALIIFFGNS